MTQPTQGAVQRRTLLSLLTVGLAIGVVFWSSRSDAPPAPEPTATSDVLDVFLGTYAARQDIDAHALPDRSSPVVARIAAGDSFSVVELLDGEDIDPSPAVDRLWYRITINGEDAYVHAGDATQQ